MAHSSPPDDANAYANTIAGVTLDLPGNAGLAPQLLAEQQQAIIGLCDNAEFIPAQDLKGPYHLTLGLAEGRLIIDVAGEGGGKLPTLVLSIKPYSKLISDYFMMVDSFEQVRSNGNPYQLEAVDMGRRGVHDEAATLLRQRLLDKIAMDHATARRLFTLICVLHLNQPRHGAMLHG